MNLQQRSCARGWQGWWRFLDPRPLEQGRDCNLEADDATGDYSDPYAVPVGGNAQLIVFDSSKIPVSQIAENLPAHQIYMTQLQKVNQLAEQADFNIFINHHPVLGFAPEKKKNSLVDAKPGNAALQAMMQDLNATRLFSNKAQVALSGHVHLFEAIAFESDHPTQFVSGNGGSANDIALPTTPASGTTPFPQAVVRQFVSTKTFGFMTMERIAQKWTMKSWDRSGSLMETCVIENKTTNARRHNYLVHSTFVCVKNAFAPSPASAGEGWGEGKRRSIYTHAAI